MRTTIRLTTPEAHRLIEGRGSEGRGVIIGLTGFAKQTRLAEQAVAADDPFAAWCLMGCGSKLEEASESLAEETSRIRTRLDSLPKQIVQGDDASQPEVTLTLAPYAYRGLLCLIRYDELVSALRQAAGHGLISRQELRDLLHRNGRLIRGLFAQPARYRQTGCITYDLISRNQAARSAVEVLVKSGFIEIWMYNDFEDICGVFAKAVSQYKSIADPDTGVTVGVE